MSSVVIILKDYEGFSRKYPVESKKIAADGSTVVSVYYNRNIITFTLVLDGGTGTESLTGKYGAKVTPPENPTKEGYVFAGWDTEGGTLASIFEKDTTYTAVWTRSSVEGISITVENQDDITVTREDKGNSLIFTAEDCDSYAWYLDNEKKGSDKTYSLDTSSLAAGTYTLALEAEKDGEWYSYFAQIKVSK